VKDATAHQFWARVCLELAFFVGYKRRLLSTPGATENTHGLGEIFSFLRHCRKAGYRGSTLDGFGRLSGHLARHTDIDYADDVADFIARKGVSSASGSK